METKEKQNFSGVLKSINGQCVDQGFPAELYINEYRETILTIREVPKEFIFDEYAPNWQSAVVALYPLDSRIFFTLIDLFFLEWEAIERADSQTRKLKVTLRSGLSIKGPAALTENQEFQAFRFKITDGYELIGLFPYNFGDNLSNFRDIHFEPCGNISVSSKHSSISAHTSLGEFEFSSNPHPTCSKRGLLLGFSHQITFEPAEPLPLQKFKDTLEKITNFISLLCGELTTINEPVAWLSYECEIYEYKIFDCTNYPRISLDLWQRGDGNRMRRQLFKISDFPDIAKELNTWFSFCSEKASLMRAHDAYGRILMDDAYGRILVDKDAHLTVNMFLTAMQMIEGYIAFSSDDGEFAEKKERIIHIITSQEGDNKELVELIENHLQSSGPKFIKAVTEFLREGINIFLDEPYSKNKFHELFNNLVMEIRNDRNTYTHSSAYTDPQLDMSKRQKITYICKAFYRAAILEKLGISKGLLKYRFSFDRKFCTCMRDIFGIEIKAKFNRNSDGFDTQMRYFSDMPHESI